MKRLNRILLIVIISLGLLTVACQQEKYTKISLEKRLPQGPVSGLLESSSPSEALPLKIAIAGVISPVMTLESYHDLIQYLSRKLNWPVELVQRPNYTEINDLIKNRHVEVAFVCSLAYVEGKADFNMELLVAPQVEGKVVYYSYLIVPADSEASKLEDLRGKVFAFTDPLSNSGRLAPTYQLSLMNERPQTFFRNYIYTYNHDYSIQAVADKLVDAAAVDSLIYDYLQTTGSPVVKKTKVIKIWGPYGIPPVVVHAELEPWLKQKLKSLFLDMHNDEDGGKILGALHIDRFVEVEDDIFNSVREMRARVAKIE